MGGLNFGVFKIAYNYFFLKTSRYIYFTYENLIGKENKSKNVQKCVALLSQATTTIFVYNVIRNNTSRTKNDQAYGYSIS